MIRSVKKIRATLRNARDLAARSRAHRGFAAYAARFRPDVEALVAEIDGWAHYVGAPSIRAFLRCAGVVDAWTRARARAPGGD